MDDWKKVSETQLPKKGEFCWHFNMEDINDADYTQEEELVKILK